MAERTTRGVQRRTPRPPMALGYSRAATLLRMKVWMYAGMLQNMAATAEKEISARAGLPVMGTDLPHRPIRPPHGKRDRDSLALIAVQRTLKPWTR